MHTIKLLERIANLGGKAVAQIGQMTDDLDELEDEGFDAYISMTSKKPR